MFSQISLLRKPLSALATRILDSLLPFHVQQDATLKLLEDSIAYKVVLFSPFYDKPDFPFEKIVVRIACTGIWLLHALPFFIQQDILLK